MSNKVTFRVIEILNSFGVDNHSVVGEDFDTMDEAQAYGRSLCKGYPWYVVRLETVFVSDAAKRLMAKRAGELADAAKRAAEHAA
jgi:hypothetical protein